MSKGDTQKSKGSGSGDRKAEPRLSKPIAVTKQLAGNRPKPQPLYCCSGPGSGSGFGGAGSSGSWIVKPAKGHKPGKGHGGIEISASWISGPGKDLVSVEKAVAKLFPCSPCVVGQRVCLCLDDGRRVYIKPKGVFSILRSADDAAPVKSRKAIAAVMLLKGWTFEQALKWMKAEFGASATQNSGREYVDILVLGDE
jgi:hypothetical protein